MTSLFSAIPIRTAADAFRTDWVNALRLAGISLETLAGAAYISPTEFTIANNQSAAANVTGLLFAGASVRSFVVEYQVYRNTTGGGATELAETGFLKGTYSTVAASWEMANYDCVGDAGILFSITAGGQVQYTSTNITGSAATSKMTFKALTMPVSV